MSNKAIFLDRDDTLIEDPGYISHPDQVKLLDGIPEALSDLKAMGYKLIVVSNQSAVARGIVTEEVLGQIHRRLEQLLAEKNAYLDRIYYCPYHPEGVVGRYRKESDWRKPNPGMLLAAAEKMELDLNQSWLIGNSNSDIEAGSRAGCKTILLNSSSRREQTGIPSTWTGKKPDYQSVNIKEAVNIIKKHHRASMAQVPEKRGPFNRSAEPAGSVPDERPAVVEEKPLSPAPPKTEHPQPETVHAELNKTTERTEQLLNSILEELKRMQRTVLLGEFSIMRLLAGIAQIIVLFCLLLAIWFLTSPASQHSAVLVALGFAAVMQLMSLTFYMMQRRT